MDKHAAFMEGFCGRLSELETQQPTACEKLASAYGLGGEAEGSGEPAAPAAEAGSATYESLLGRLAEIEKEAGFGDKMKGAAGAAGRGFKRAGGAAMSGMKSATSWAGAHKKAVGVGAGAAAAGAGGYALYKHLKNKKKDD